jgi:predicted Zn-dependent protease
MLFHRLGALLACAAVVSACVTAPPPKPAPTLAALMASADAAIKAGRNDDAAAWLTSAIAAFPADKAPRVRMAQLQFECHNYGEAITHAQQVLNRDPDDQLAHSLVAVSGLRVSSKALSDLVTRNKLTGDVRSEAQDLAKLLRANIGGDIIVPIKATGTRPAPTRPVRAVPPKAANDSPADWLNN